MKIIDKIIAAVSIFFATAAAIFSAIFCIKSQKKIDVLEKEKQDRILEENQKIQAIQKAYKKEQQENEELKNKAMAGNNDSSDAALNELLYNAAKKGKQRNNSSDL